MNLFKSSRKHTFIILIPLNPTLYSKTGVNSGIHYVFLFLLKNIYCVYSLEPPRQGGSNEYPQSLFFEQKFEKYLRFLSENFQFLEVKFPIYLKRRVFVVWV